MQSCGFRHRTFFTGYKTKGKAPPVKMSEMTEIKDFAFKAGETLIVKGVPTEKSQFSINLGWDDDNYALHLNPRLNNNCIVMNSKNGGNWEEVKYASILPFKMGQEFQVSISFTNSEFKMMLPGDNVIRFPNRKGAEEFAYMTFAGDAKFHMFNIL